MDRKALIRIGRDVSRDPRGSSPLGLVLAALSRVARTDCVGRVRGVAAVEQVTAPDSRRRNNGGNERGPSHRPDAPTGESRIGAQSRRQRRGAPPLRQHGIRNPSFRRVNQWRILDHRGDSAPRHSAACSPPPRRNLLRARGAITSSQSVAPSSPPGRATWCSVPEACPTRSGA